MLAERSDQSHDVAENLFIVEIDTHVGKGSPHKSVEHVLATKNHVRKGSPHESVEYVLATKNHVGEGSPHKSVEDVLETIVYVGEGSPHELVIEKEIEEVLSSKVSDNDEVAVVNAKNRNFLTVNLGGCDYRALYDSGSTLSLVSKKIAKKFQDRLEPVQTRIESAMGITARCLGEFTMYLVVDSVADVLKFKAMDNLTHDIIQGMDFIEKWDIVSRRKE